MERSREGNGRGRRDEEGGYGGMERGGEEREMEWEIGDKGGHA